MADAELRLECLKLAFKSYIPQTSLGERTDEYNKSVPVYVTTLANEYFEYLLTGKTIEHTVRV